MFRHTLVPDSYLLLSTHYMRICVFLFPTACCLFPFPNSQFPFRVSRFVFPTFHFRPSTTPIFHCPDSTGHLLHGIFGFLICTFKIPFSNFPYSAFQIPASGFRLLVSHFPFPISRFWHPACHFWFIFSAFSFLFFASRIPKLKELFSDSVLEFSHSFLVLETKFRNILLVPVNRITKTGSG